MHNTSSGQVSVSVPESRGVFEQNRDAVRDAAGRRRVPSSQDLARRLGLPPTPCALNPRLLAVRDEGELHVEKGFIVTETGDAPEIMTVVPVLRLAPNAPRRALVYCAEDGLQGIDAEEEALLRAAAARGIAVYVAEPRGTGETRSRPLAPWGTWLTDTWLSQYLRMLGTSLGALRAYDLTRILEYVRTREGDAPVGLMAGGFLAWAAVLAAALDRRVDRLCLDAAPASIEEFATTWTVSPPEPSTIPGVLQMGDLPDFVAASGVPRTLLVSPGDAHGHAVSVEAWPRRHAAWEAVEGLQVAVGADRVQRHEAVLRFVIE
jgi:hypothetical protein